MEASALYASGFCISVYLVITVVAQSNVPENLATAIFSNAVEDGTGRPTDANEKET